MCFSATASFTASAVLLIIGFFTVRDGHGSNYDFLSYFPVFFGVQQGFEGVVWLAINGVVADWVGSLASYAFLLFAVVLWPVFFAAAAARVATDKKRRNWIEICVWFGVAWAVISSIVLFVVPVSYAAPGGHISYDIIDPSLAFYAFSLAFYTGIGVIPLYAAEDTAFTVVGSLILGAGIISQVVASQWFTSIWCFWAAVISVSIYYVVS